MKLPDWQNCLDELGKANFCTQVGRVSKVSGLLIESIGPDVFVGELCKVINPHHDSESCLAEVVGFRSGVVLLMPFGDTRGVGPRSEVIGTGDTLRVGVGEQLLGRVVDPFCKPLDGLGELNFEHEAFVRGNAQNPLERSKINQQMETGIKAIDTFLPLGKGQRIGIFAGSGVGKSTLLGMIARNSRSEINVIALVGERGREVGEFLENCLGKQGLKNTVVVTATSDQSALMRELAAHTATTIAEYFCEKGRDVMLIMDSVSRYAMAHREIGLSAGEPPTSRGYTPSVFTALPKLLERAGNFRNRGSITGVYTVLVEGDDLQEPVADHVRAVVDGHIVLSRSKADHGQYPAIDLLKSVSRLSGQLWSDSERESIRKSTGFLSLLEQHRDMVELGAYNPGANSELDQALSKQKALNRFCSQEVGEAFRKNESFALLDEVLK